MLGNLHLETLRRHIYDGWKGRELASYCTAEVDKVIKEVLSQIGKEPPYAIFATGSYGRGELCPYSDVDIMIYSNKESVGERVKELLYRLWDTGLDISHAFRTPQDCIRDALQDMQIRTSLIEARFICGSMDIANTYSSEVLQKLRAKRSRDYVAGKLKEIRLRHKKHGNSPFLLQPDVKESRGGLRDINGVLWLSSVVFKKDNIEGLSELIGKEDLKKYLRAYDFLLRLRFAIHVISRRKNDRLLFEVQDHVAELLGIKGSKKFTSVERMMRYYFLKAGTISSISDRIFSMIGSKYARRRFNLRTKRLSDNFSVSKNLLIASSDDVFRESPDRIMELFSLYAENGYPLSEHLTELVKRNIIYINDHFRKNKKVIYEFFKILSSKRVSDTLRYLHETGVLGKFIPEFGAVRYLLVNSYYHEFPVDEHSLKCIENLEDIAGQGGHNVNRIKEIHAGLKKKELLYLAILLHDIGKSKGRYHETEGYKLIKKVSDRMDLDVKSRDFIEQLVKNHVFMSKVAFKYDIESPYVISQFAERISNEDMLDSIYLMTYSDMASVSKSYWTNWRALLLHELYMKTKDHLRGIRKEGSDQDKLIRARSEGFGSVGEFELNMNEQYFISTPETLRKRESMMYAKAKESGLDISIENRDDGTTDLTIITHDKEGVFSSIVSVLVVRKLNIIEARLFTSKDGYVVDRIRMSNWKELWWEGMDELLMSDLKEAIERRKIYTFGDRPRKKRGIETFIEVDNEVMENRTVVEIMAPDRDGLLYDISVAFSKNGMNISGGKIYTEQDVANDVFYLDVNGQSVHSHVLYKMIGELWEKVKYQEDI
ncbi:MAG: [protein-PII] uridylyltransferase [Nitrospirota bacterium]|nr:MAG: [protein-PII] uridylyltransferase [Nitrospirota bacterium]